MSYWRTPNSNQRARAFRGIERLESRSLMAGLVNVCDTMMKPPTQPGAVVAGVQSRADLDQSDLVTFETQKPAAKAARAPKAEPCCDDKAIWGSDCDWLDFQGDLDLGQPKSDGNDCDCECDDPNHHDDSGDEPLVPGESQPDTSFIGSTEDASTAELDRTNDTAPGPMLGPIYARPNATSSTPANAAANRASANSVAFRYFSETSPATASGRALISSEPSARYAARETFVFFSLLPAEEVDDVGPGQILVAESSKRMAPPSSRDPSTGASVKTDGGGQSEADAIRAAERAIQFASSVLDATGTTPVDCPTCLSANANDSCDPLVSANLTESAAVGDAMPSESRYAGDTLRGNLKLGLVSIVSILFSIRSVAPVGDHKREPVPAVRGRTPLRGARILKAHRRDRIADSQLFDRE
ncbi:hypothetical protein CA51_28150 [Rosistilla oblonga]|uniref:hypothetical protein n=1 Tax=Rosistilla oblonga TaxID=2527990 RepID=UPI00118AC4CF|nr:hypothetical protein [Rosistilla oblonga]QDV12929.1 hypothetical protein CA51_28150 [Rosistilla oblonga]